MNVHTITVRLRTLSTILGDLREARGDYDDAIADPEAEDRATAAETRLDDLREEAATCFARANGCTIEHMRKWFADGLI